MNLTPRQRHDVKAETGDGLGQRFLNFLTTAILLGAIGYIGIDLYRVTARGADSPVVPASAERLPWAGAATMGSPDAKTALMVFSDFECGACGRFARETLSFLKREYVDQGLLKIAYRHYLLPTHQHAIRLAQASECAGAQGRFWDAHDRIFGELSTRLGMVARDLPDDLHLDEAAFASCLSADPRSFIQRDRILAVRTGVTGTPTIFVGRVDQHDMLIVTQVLRGAQPTVAFSAAIDRLLR